jgi:ferric-dicitrate binding protein FerR (iron transport regulator)
MSTHYEMPDDLKDLVDAYLGGTIDEARLQALENHLRADADARGQFVRYCHMHTDLHLEARAQQAGQRALRAIDELQQRKSSAATPRAQRAGRWWLAIAAAVLAALGLWWWSGIGRDGQGDGRDEIAWLTNAQDCQWADHQAPAGDMRPGKTLRLQHGLAEIRFQSGARVLLEGPAGLELLSSKSARLLHGKLTAKVPGTARGFQVTSPHGKIVDLGTEFGMSVAADGTTDVYVFTGRVDAYADAAPAAGAGSVSVLETQAARIDATGVALQPADKAPDAGQFVRAIVPPPRIVPRTFALDFRQAVRGTVLDASGTGTGLAYRLPGTGARLPTHDANLRLEVEQGRLELTTTNTDLNTSYRLDWGEYLGVRLADLGFTGKEDFAITVVVPDIPELPRVGQFGLYAGLDSRQTVRGGMISTKEPRQYKQFLVENHDGRDAPPHYVGVGFPGDDLRLTLRREGKHFTLTVENQTTGNSSTIKARQPDFLDGEADLHAGFFGANTQSNVQRTLKLKEFQVTVWTVAAP